MKISVLIPIYGVEKYIERCLRSLFTQTLTNGVEFILVNDCTKDKSMQVAERIIKEFAHLDIKTIHHQTNKGLAAARLSGLEIATGEYILHIDSDDWCTFTMLEELYETAIETNADLIQFAHISHYNDKPIYCSANLPDAKEDLLTALLHIGKCHNIWSKFIKRKLFTIDDIFFYPGINMGEDFIASCKLFHYANNIYILEKAFVHHECTNLHSLTKSKATILRKKERLMALNTIGLFLKEKGYNIPDDGAFLKEKLELKFFMLTNTRGHEQKYYNKMWPELDKYIFQSNLRFYNKVALYFASKNYLSITNVIFYIKSVLKWIFR